MSSQASRRTHKASLLALVIFLLGSASGAMGTALQGLPYKSDPPLAIDGQLGDWSVVPAVWPMETAAHVTFGKSMWTSPADVNARVQMAWRYDCLFIAVNVIDDKFFQTQRGKAMYMGDHVELNVDATPDVDRTREGFGEGQFVIGLNPGNFVRSGDMFKDIPPEGYVYVPSDLTSSNIRTAALRTESGYTLEASIPWKLFGITDPEIGTRVSIEVAVSDCDASVSQDTMITLVTDPWDRKRSRMVHLVLTGTDGKVPDTVSDVQVFDTLKLKPGGNTEFKFTVPEIPKNKTAVLAFQARLEHPQPAGYNPRMRLTVNGRQIESKLMMNKQSTMEANDGRTFTMAAGNDLSVCVGPAYQTIDTSGYGLKQTKASLFELNVGKLLKKGENTLAIQNGEASGAEYELVADAGAVQFRAPVKPKAKQGPPKGRLAVIEPISKLKTAYYAEQLRGGDIALTCGGNKFVVESKYSTPAPEWVKESNSYFTLNRRIEKRDEAIVVYDTFENLTDENLPIMHRHGVKIDGLEKSWLSGLSSSTPSAFSSEPQNPTSYAVTKKLGMGLLPLDDIFRVHVTNYVDGETVGVADNLFVLKPKARYTAEWAIIPTSKPDYYTFINAARRLLDVNFTLQNTGATMPFRPVDSGSMNDKDIVDFLKNKSATWLLSGYIYPNYGALNCPHSVAYHEVVDHTYEKAELDRVRKAAPWVKVLNYFDCFLEEVPDYWPKYHDCRTLASDGTQGCYFGRENMKIFLPTSSNAWGRDIAKNIDYSLDVMGYDGVYWDELEYSVYRYHYGEPWDGCSADINPTTMKIDRLKTSVTLVSLDFHVAMAKKVLDRGMPLLGNSAPNTRTFASLKFPCFTETGTISYCTTMHLYSPLALGDHLTEKNEVDAYRWMLKALNYGCVYFWYDASVKATHPTLTEYMFPITPMELHAGYIIGKERIVTNRSGLYGWGDKSNHDVHVFDDQGREVPKFKAPTVVKNGKTYTELRISEDWSAAIVRKEPLQ